ncbi:MAG: glycosyltransferase [Desulfuromonadales bacterium]|nr:MAG: glycosyltransferase [Desulfuromonadales bacterium]
MPPVFIGMPVYNGGKYIGAAIDSVLKQSYQNWTLLISDNNSDDDTAAIALDYSSRDPRIRYIKQDINRGVADNFLYLLNQSDSEFFAWFAADDIWLPDFLSTCMNKLSSDSSVGLCFTNLQAIDDNNDIVRGCPVLPTLSGRRELRTALKYVVENEISGKANLIYGVIKTNLAKIAWEKTITGKSFWGQDMCFVLAVICRGGVHVDRNICFYKRYSQPVDPEESKRTCNYSKNPHIPFKDFISYFNGMLHATSGTPYYWPTFAAMSFRLISNLINGAFK